jgi:hypothetical protein
MAWDWHRVIKGDLDQCSDLATTIGEFVAGGCVPLLDTGQLFINQIQAACRADCDCGIVVAECAGIVDCS